jgi:heme/copper-type cytochrome/quinol oxidase subunit 1
MPRRIPDYADGYASWNNFMTIGSFLTAISLIIFLYVVYTTFNPLARPTLSRFHSLNNPISLS